MTAVRRACLALAGLALTIGAVAVGYPIPVVVPMVIVIAGMTAAVQNGEIRGRQPVPADESVRDYYFGFVIADAFAIWAWTVAGLVGVGVVLAVVAAVVVGRWAWRATPLGSAVRAALKRTAHARERAWGRVPSIVAVVFAVTLALNGLVHVLHTEWSLGIPHLIAAGCWASLYVVYLRTEAHERRTHA